MLSLNEIVVIPHGSIEQRIGAMIDASLIAKHIGSKISMIWTHPIIEYDFIFLNNINMVTIDYLNGKNYKYNPSIDSQMQLLKDCTVGEEQMILVLESKKPMIHPHMSYVTYIQKRANHYQYLLEEMISGVIQGNLNMITPVNPKCRHVYGGDLDGYTRMHINLEEVDKMSPEGEEFLKMLAVSKADIIVCDHLNELYFAIRAASIRMIPVVVRCKITDRKVFLPHYFPFVACDFMGYPCVVFPCMEKLLKIST
jgi:hypothetical protein